MNNARKPLTATIAVGVALAMPMAFAQDPAASTGHASPTTGAATAAAPQDHARDATAEAPRDPQGRVTWADLDTDGDGRLSQSEAAGLEGFTQVFSAVDADGDGFVTPQEYRDFVNRQAAGAGAPGD